MGIKGRRPISARTAQRLKGKFLEAYARLGNASAVQDETGISRFHHIKWLAKSADYRKRFEEAEEAATEILEREALRRAVHGREEPVYYNGQQVGKVTKYSDVLLIFLLKAKRPDVYRERYDARIQANLNVQSAVKVIHEYHDAPPSIDVQAVDTQPNRQLMSATLIERGQADATLTVPVPQDVPAPDDTETD